MDIDAPTSKLAGLAARRWGAGPLCGDLAGTCLAPVKLDGAHVGRATLFIAADDSDGMTGQHILVDAGIAQQSVIS